MLQKNLVYFSKDLPKHLALYKALLSRGLIQISVGGSFLVPCHKTSNLVGSKYRCIDPKCECTQAEEIYSVSVFAHDDIAETEFMLFDKVARGVIGKTLISLLKFRYPGHPTIEDIARIQMVDTIPPPEVTQLVGQKYKLVAAIAKRSFSPSSDHLSFQVVRIIETFKPELSSSAFGNVTEITGPSSSASVADVPSSAFGMFTPSTTTIVPPHAVSSSGNFSLTQQTPTTEPKTPTSKMAMGTTAASIAGKSPCSTRGARRLLFTKKACIAEEPVSTNQDNAK